MTKYYKHGDIVYIKEKHKDIFWYHPNPMQVVGMSFQNRNVQVLYEGRLGLYTVDDVETLSERRKRKLKWLEIDSI
jgi:hypothetical protein